MACWHNPPARALQTGQHPRRKPVRLYLWQMQKKLTFPSFLLRLPMPMPMPIQFQKQPSIPMSMLLLKQVQMRPIRQM